MKIQKISAREILDSRGNPTVEAKVVLENGLSAVAKVPSGASTGTHEALELRDGGKRYGGKGVLRAVKNVNTEIAKAVQGMEVTEMEKIDAKMLGLDGTANKSKLGANAILAVSLAVARAGAMSLNLPLYKYIRQVYKVAESSYRMPVLGMNIINGGRHADNGLSIQEFMIMPRHKLLRERVRMGSQIFHALAGLLSQKGFSTGVGDEGGFAPELVSNERGIQFILQAIKLAGWQPGKDVFLGLDIAASEFYRHGSYYFMSKKQGWTGAKLMDTLKQWVKKYPIISIEDALAEDDWANWKILTKELGKKIVLVGDDLFVTNPERIARGIKEQVANSVLIKVNQIGTLSETMAAIKLARQNKYQIFISHRSGETADTFIADLAVAVNSEFIKTGSMSRSERIEKYNRLMEIEAELE
ncbi:MAG: phosphopyruvate hydratase [Candidatus Magasanikbacteria bacterium RIFOXYD2_FULL_39_9]|uniref:Enolase n=1 Tax=Candidatus Magasanikbacteria bacterium RIFOXYD1_FULL_40_23 TaxID=1798705 RepID=A0A1F6P836_9BACT|nr:MAG: phosphopyruvate hydratase [Candidatus Magasanikbacteria bacterium RIFOXYD1_FULL_40_23]OGH92997.1 MAG: phosphopyruvate hydratase [Candidatus Magasanikbacteria bacterium RIFOXYD2_FULL_39_9]